MTGKELVKLLEKNGWEHVRTTGSHFQMRKDGVTIPVPVHGKRDLPPGTLHVILKGAGLK